MAKLVYQSGQPAQRTDYLSGCQYEGDSLRFFPHAAGRVLRFVSTDAAGQASVRYEREYSLKDHLGNLRLAYRLGHVRRDSASLEPNTPTHTRESQQFDSLSVSAPIAQHVGSGIAKSGSYVARLNAGGNAPQPLGPLRQLAVQKGDTVTVSAYGLYHTALRNNFWYSLASFLTGLFHPAPGAPVGPDPTRGRAGLPLLQVGVAAGLTYLPQLSGGVPRGYLRVLVFNADSALVSQQVQQLSSAALNYYERLRLRVLVPQDGYVSAFVGNESDADVLFDDIIVELRQGLQVQETQYDPTGLEMAGLTGTTPGLKSLSQYKFNGKEFQTDLGLNWNHQDWRFFDTQLARWHVTDPEIENGQESWTPYSFGFDNAVRFNDPDGRVPGGGDPHPFANTIDYTVGVINAVLDNALGTNTSSRYNPSRPDAYGSGQSDGNIGSQVAGAYMMVDGARNAAAGGAVVLGSLELEIGSGGTATVVAGPGAAAGATLAGAGLLESYLGSRLFANGSKKQGSQQRENADGNNKPTRSERAAEKKAKSSSAKSQYGEGAEHTSNKNKLEQHQKDESRRAMDRGGEKGDANRDRYQDSKKTRRK